MHRIIFIAATVIVAAPFALASAPVAAPKLAGTREQLAQHAAATPKVSARDAKSLTRSQVTITGHIVQCKGLAGMTGEFGLGNLRTG